MKEVDLTNFLFIIAETIRGVNYRFIALCNLFVYFNSFIDFLTLLSG
jgi:hypothetical protein